MVVFWSLSVQHGRYVGGGGGVALSRIKITSITLQVNRGKYWGKVLARLPDLWWNEAASLWHSVRGDCTRHRLTVDTDSARLTADSPQPRQQLYPVPGRGQYLVSPRALYKDTGVTAWHLQHPATATSHKQRCVSISSLSRKTGGEAAAVFRPGGSGEGPMCSGVRSVTLIMRSEKYKYQFTYSHIK